MRDKTNGRDGADESVWRPFQASLHSPPLSLMSDTLARTDQSFKKFCRCVKKSNLDNGEKSFIPIGVAVLKGTIETNYFFYLF